MSGGSKAPAGYQPKQQAQADSGYMSNLSSLAAGGQNLVNTAIPGYQGIYQATQANPYYSGAMAGATDAAAAGQGYQQNNASYANTIAGMAGQIPAYQAQMQAYASPIQGYQQNLGAFAQPIQGYANQIMQTAFDPQQALYNRNFQQQMDQQNAINAMYGVAGSPYGAGVAGQTANNFNIDWQNAQLQRQAQGAQALGSLGSTMEGLYNTSAGLGATGAGIYGQAANLDSLASGLYGQASNLNQSGLDVAYQTSQLPNAAYLQQLGANQAALDALVSGTSGAYGLTQGAIGDYGNYLKLGQSATANAQNAANINNQQSAGGLAGLGKLAGAGLTFFNPVGSAASLAGQGLMGAGG